MENPIVECEYCHWEGPSTELVSVPDQYPMGTVISYNCPICGETYCEESE